MRLVFDGGRPGLADVSAFGAGGFERHVGGRTPFRRFSHNLVRGEMMTLFLQHVLAAVAFSIIGIAAFGGCLWAVNHWCPFPLRKEIEEDQNTAVAIIIGAMIIGIAMIVSSAIQG